MTGAAAPVEPLGKRERAKRANREAILDAAREVFGELGYGQATVRDVIRRTRLASGTFYNYFPDKESVFRALLEADAEVLRERLRLRREQATSFEELVRDGFRTYFEYWANDPAALALMRRNAGTIRAMFDDPVLGLGVVELQEDLAAAIERGDLPAGLDPEYLAAALAGVGIEMGIRLVEREPVDVDAAVDFATALFLGGVERIIGGG